MVASLADEPRRSSRSGRSISPCSAKLSNAVRRSVPDRLPGCGERRCCSPAGTGNWNNRSIDRTPSTTRMAASIHLLGDPYDLPASAQPPATPKAWHHEGMAGDVPEPARAKNQPRARWNALTDGCPARVRVHWKNPTRWLGPPELPTSSRGTGQARRSSGPVRSPSSAHRPRRARRRPVDSTRIRLGRRVSGRRASHPQPDGGELLG